MLKAAIYRGVNRHSLSGSYASLDFNVLDNAAPVMEFIVDSVQINRSIVELTTFTVTTNINNFQFITDFPIVKNINYYIEVEYYGTVIVNGLLFETNIDLASGEITFECNDMLYILNYAAAVPNLIINTKTALAAAYTLLKNIPLPGPTTGNNQYKFWEISRFYTSEFPPAPLRVDLRDEKTILSQLQKICESVPKFYYRYGGNKIVHLGMSLFTITHSIEFGTFDDDTGMQYNEKNIDQFNIRIPNEPLTKGFYGFGGKYKTGTPATVANILRASDKGVYGNIISPYIINGPANFTYDNGITNFDYDYAVTTLYYKDIQTDTLENPTSLEKQEAGDGVYSKGIAEIKETQQDTEIEISSSEFPLNVMPGNKVQLSFSYFLSAYDAMTGQTDVTKIPGFSLDNATYYIKSYSMEINQEEKKINYVLQSGNEFKRDASQEKILVSLGRQLREAGEFFTLPSPLHNIGFYNFTIPTGTSPNLTLSGNDWYEFTVTKTTDWYLGAIKPIPTGSSVIQYYALDLEGGAVKHYNQFTSGFIEQFYKENDWIIDSWGGSDSVNNGKYIAKFTSRPDTSSPTFKIAVKPVIGSWTTNNSVTVKAIVVFQV